MDRRRFLKTLSAAAIIGVTNRLRAEDQQADQVITVTGPVAAERLGMVLPHEHILVDFIGADQVSSARYVADEVYEVALPHLKRAKQQGCQTFVDCTPAFLARDPELLKRLSRASGLQILTNTGYYGAGDGKYLPKHAHQESADQLARRWLAEWTDGIDGTDVRPGFIKIGVDAGRLTDVNRKLVQAAARTHLKSGLAIACHTGDGTAAMEELDILRAEGVDPSAWIWVHAQNERDRRLHEQAAARGGWVEFDGVDTNSIERHVELATYLKDRGLLRRVLISHDAGWYSVGEPGGGRFRPYTAVFDQFLPALARAGWSGREIKQVTAENPARAFAIRVRTAVKM